MAVTLTVAQVRERIGSFPAGEYDPTQLWFDVASAAVVKYAPAAPDSVHNLACLMMVDYWDGSPDPPHVSLQADGGGRQWQVSMMKSGNALRYSGALVLLTQYKRRRAL